jgi:hypothetical protein
MCPESEVTATPSEEVELIRMPGFSSAEPILAVLRANGIPARTSGEAVGRVYGFTLNGLGEVTIFVPEEFAEQARELLAAGEQHTLELDDGEEMETGDGAVAPPSHDE